MVRQAPDLPPVGLVDRPLQLVEERRVGLRVVKRLPGASSAETPFSGIRMTSGAVRAVELGGDPAGEATDSPRESFA